MTNTGLISANGGIKLGSNGSTKSIQKLYSVTTTVSANSTDSFNLTISGFTTTPNHVIASIYNNGTFNCSIIAHATSATNIGYWVANSNILFSTFTAYFTISQF